MFSTVNSKLDAPHRFRQRTLGRNDLRYDYARWFLSCCYLSPQDSIKCPMRCHKQQSLHPIISRGLLRSDVPSLFQLFRQASKDLHTVFPHVTSVPPTTTMQPISLFTLALLLRLSTANPLPANVNTPISDAEWASLRDGGLESRDAHPATVTQPISESEWKALQDGGLSRRGDEVSLVARDKVMNCGHTIKGKGGSNVHGAWVPVAEFVGAVERFCMCPFLYFADF